jgi:hypothetical protein
MSALRAALPRAACSRVRAWNKLGLPYRAQKQSVEYLSLSTKEVGLTSVDDTESSAILVRPFVVQAKKLRVKLNNRPSTAKIDNRTYRTTGGKWSDRQNRSRTKRRMVPPMVKNATLIQSNNPSPPKRVVRMRLDQDWKT